MKAIFDRLKAHAVSYSLLILGSIMALVAMIVYLVSGTTVFNPDLNFVVVAFSIIGMALAIVPFFFPGEKLFFYLPYLCYLFAFLEYLVSQATYITNIFVSIDETSVSGSFLSITILYLLSFVSSLLGGIFAKERKIKERESYAIKEEE